MRKIKVLSTVGVSGTIETNVTTLGELKPLLSQREINYGGMKMMVGETRNELNRDDSVLPEGDFKLYLMPAKTKSGSVSNICTRIAALFEALAEELDNSNPCTCNSGTKHNLTPVDEDVEDLRKLAGGFDELSYSDEEEDEDEWL